jgi:hypothetical protein
MISAGISRSMILEKRVSAMVRIAPDRQGRAVFRPEVCAPVHSSHGNCG